MKTFLSKLNFYKYNKLSTLESKVNDVCDIQRTPLRNRRLGN